MRNLFAVLLVIFGSGTLWADPVITEFMASNKNGLEDEDGSNSDWIEIHNPDAVPASLKDWSLTDSASNLRKWIFPDIVLPPDGYLVVFASNKNRRVPGQELHTNFALSADGEYLALVKPDGTTRTTEFAPGFPPQYQDISYGVSSSIETVTLVGKGTAARGTYDSTGALGSAWIAPAFNDTGWVNGTLGAGYFNVGGSSNPDLSTQVGLNLLASSGNQPGMYVRTVFQIPDPSKVYSLRLRMLYDDGFAAYLNGQSAAAGNAPATPNYNSLALSNHPPSAYENFDLTLLISKLTAGTNTLALHGLNVTASSTDLFLLPELTAVMDTGVAPVTGYFSRATPRALNGGPSSIRLPQIVAYSRPSGPFATTFSLTLSGAVSGQQIRYVMADPSSSGAALAEPTMDSTLYTGPISIATSKFIRAAVFDPSTGAKGRTVSAQFLQLETGSTNNTSNFSSILPVAVTDDHGAGQPVDSSTNSYTTSMFYLFEPTSGTARLDATPTLATRSGMRVRGSSSASFPKKSLALETWDEFNDDAKTPLLDLSSDSDWVLTGPWAYDDAYCRSALVYELSREVGRWAPRTRFVEMFHNWNGGKLDYSDYAGIYVLTEKIKSTSHRLSITGIEPSDVLGEAVTGGYIFKIDRADPDEVAWTTSTGVPFQESGVNQKLIIVEPDPDDDTSEQVDYLKSYVGEFDSTLNQERASSFTTRNYLHYIDRLSWIDHHILNALMCNIDGLRLSAFFHKDRGERIQAGPVWDFDRSAGSDDDRDDNPLSWNSQTYFFTLDWWERLFRDPDFVQAWVDRWFELRSGALSNSNLIGILNGYGSQIGNEAGARDAARWPDNAPAGAYLNEISSLRSWLVSHASWIDGQLPAPPVSNTSSALVTPGTQVSLSGSGVIRYTVDGSDPRSGDSTIYSGPLTINQTTVLTARRQGTFSPFPSAATTNWSAPVRRVYLVNETFAAPGDIAVSEINYRPAPPTTEELEALPEVSTNDFQFIEIRNIGNNPVNVFEVVFQNPATPLRPIKLDAMSLAPGEHAVIVKRRDAFVLRYGAAAGSRIAAEWSVGSLPEEGSLQLTSRSGSPLETVTYQDDVREGGSLNRFDATNWRADAPSPGTNGPTFAQWQNYHFPASDSSPDDDPDLDSAANLEEYARGTDPQNSEDALDFSLTFAFVDGNYLLTYKRPVYRPSATFQIEQSTDLANWVPSTEHLISTTNGIEMRGVTGSPNDEPKLFFRLKTTVAH